MNLLAKVVHNLVNGNEASNLEKLPLSERKALTDLTALLELSPQELADVLGDNQGLPDWGRKIQFISET